ncbi:hypothetical protein HanXRQr2_Chr09g0369781 [Helianthus annuus]|uniref:Uncharacterized protein n=1 Tax=Helianthus annuus TaxID=4232 RepID=A0A9K3I2N8_HELAN|nr:hypothetical protein HanXRQr2_Chr09g0369781 [Helianthus annuus]KAJ0891627.1 hypothetical protein HanPSC8_Chr09g0356231 [Helianthus annuus]
MIARTIKRKCTMQPSPMQRKISTTTSSPQHKDACRSRLATPQHKRRLKESKQRVRTRKRSRPDPSKCWT